MKKGLISTIFGISIIFGGLWMGGHAFATTEIDKDQNTSIEEAQEILLDTEVEGMFEYRHDMDFYEVIVPKEGILTINLNSVYMGTYLSILDTNLNYLNEISVNTFKNVTENDGISINIPKGTYYFKVETDGAPSSGGAYSFKTEFIKKQVKPQKVMWGKTELKLGQIGKVTIHQDTNLVKLQSNGTLTTIRPLKKGEEYRVYSYKSNHGGLYGVGGGNFVQKNIKVKYETPSKAKMSLLVQ
ncbi:hypothetical protein MKZ20_13140 [Psychrobacillus sp. FSL K6-2684]|uniref:hypothetical protein n=1 Tax=unclassified Psychrobacillus TaxID=2636677 RepID=UPI0011A44975